MINRKFVAAILTLTMIAGSMPAAVLADETVEETSEEVTEEVVEAEETPADEEPVEEEAPEEEPEEEPEITETATGKVPSYSDGTEVVHVTSAANFGTLDSEGRYILNSNKTYILDNDITTAGRIVTDDNANVTIKLMRIKTETKIKES